MTMLDILSVIGISAMISTIISFFLDVLKQSVTLKNEKLFIEKSEKYKSIILKS